MLRVLLNVCCVAQADVKIMSLPSKRQGLYTATGSTIIARSDSNGEDLEAFAGAGNLFTACSCMQCSSNNVLQLQTGCNQSTQTYSSMRIIA